MRRRTRAWIGVGASFLTGVGMTGQANAASAEAPGQFAMEAPAPGGMSAQPQPHVQMLLAQHSMGGEGGEGGEGGAAAGASPEAAFLTNIALIRGHLSVGKELVDAGQWDDALVHFLHPSIEIYADVSEAIVDYDIDPFGDELLMLASAVKKQSKDEFQTRFDGVQTALAGAVEKAGELDAGTKIDALLAVLATAADEYGASMEDGKFVAVVEYQDSRGFVAVAEEMLPDLQLPDDKLTEVKAAMEELKKAWPAPVPPDAPVLDPGAVLASVSQIELALSSAR